MKRAVAETVTALGRLDILVNNAGIAALAPLEQFSLENFDRTVAINVRGVFVATQAAVRHMTAGGRVITIGSVNAMSKAAIVGLTKGLARDLGSRGITVNNI